MLRYSTGITWDLDSC